ncbi:MAG TPA: hypothetical protein PLB62_13765 [Candidatus Sumerlaeota bacterium]|nr:hypothetical protein [Candidatus Sumerlaeota bacterium]
MRLNCIRFASILILSLVAGLAQASDAIEIPLNYVSYPAKRTPTFLPLRASEMEVLVTAPPGNWKLPELKSKNPVYALVKLGDTERLAIFDRINSEDQFFTRVHLDINANGDLTDDAPLDQIFGRAVENAFYQANFSRTDFTYRIGEKILPNNINFKAVFYIDPSRANQGFTRETLKNNLNLTCWIHACYEFKLNLGADTWNGLLYDVTGNGLYNDVPVFPENLKDLNGPVYPESDEVYLARNRKCIADDAIPLGSQLLIRGTLYNVSVCLPVGKMILTPRTDNLVPVRLPVETDKLMLYDEASKHSISMVLPELCVNIPAGRYIPAQYSLLRREPDGPQWRLSAFCSSQTPALEINNAESAVLKYGEPFGASILVLPWTCSAFVAGEIQHISIDMQSHGAGLEIVTDLSCLAVPGEKPSRIPLSMRSPSRSREAVFTISEPDGRIVKQGTFEYG